MIGFKLVNICGKDARKGIRAEESTLLESACVEKGA